MFHIDDDSGKKEKHFHSCVAKQFRDFKCKLVHRYITLKEKPPKCDRNKMPWEIYDHIDADD